MPRRKDHAAAAYPKARGNDFPVRSADLVNLHDLLVSNKVAGGAN